MSTPPRTASTARRAQQRRRAQEAGGGALAGDRSELLALQHARQRQLADAVPKGLQHRGHDRDQDRSSIVWLPAPTPLSPRSRCTVVGYGTGIVLPGWLAALIDNEATT